MNDFQQLKDRNFVLPQTVYRQALYAIKDLDRLRKKLEAAGDKDSDKIVETIKGVGYIIKA